MAYQISTVHPFRATVVFDGANPKSLESVANIGGSVLAFYAGEDEGVNQGIPLLVEAMINTKKISRWICLQGDEPRILMT